MKREPPKIVHEYPPNYDLIVAAFPQCRRPGIIFAYAPCIYVPDGTKLSDPIKVHEAVHIIRQEEFGVDKWWEYYIEDKKFRYHEELLAHRAEYLAILKSNPNRSGRRVALKTVAQRLASPLYGCGGGWKKAAEDIKKDIKK